MTVERGGGEAPEPPVEVTPSPDSGAAEHRPEPELGPSRREHADRTIAELESDERGPTDSSETDPVREGADPLPDGERQRHAATLEQRLTAGGDDPSPDRTAEDLYAFGGSKEDGYPRPPRLEQDLRVESPDDPVGPYAPQAPTDEVHGGSTFKSVEDGQRIGLTGQVFRLEAGSELPSGLGVHADGEDVGGNQARGHRTIFPSERMTASEMQTRWAEELPWAHHGTVNRKTGAFEPAEEQG
jgi:hypothetical protein